MIDYVISFISWDLLVKISIKVQSKEVEDDFKSIFYIHFFLGLVEPISVGPIETIPVSLKILRPKELSFDLQLALLWSVRIFPFLLICEHFLAVCFPQDVLQFIRLDLLKIMFILHFFKDLLRSERETGSPRKSFKVSIDQYELFDGLLLTFQRRIWLHLSKNDN